MPSSADRQPGDPPRGDLDGRLLRYFLAVVRQGSIRGAAATLNVAASAVSRQISELELRFGLKLLERLPRGVVPTEAGEALAEHARQFIENNERLLDDLRQLQGLRRGAVRIRCGEGFVGDLLDNGLQPFAAAWPDIGLQVSLGGTQEILSAVAESHADLGLAYNPPAHVGLRSLAMARQPLHMMVAPGHPLAGRDSVALRELAGGPVALLTRQHGIRQLLGRVEADQRFHLVPQMEAGSIDILRRFAMAGQSATFLPRFAAASEIAQGRLVAVPLADPILAEASAHLVVRARRRLPAAVEQLADLLTTRLQAFKAPAAEA
jgi:DNA-binding transcriptional LysR family regulator